jgi:hypothetical protein
MPRLYEILLKLYPASHRQDFGKEMLTVFRDLEYEKSSRPLIQRGVFYLRETAGVLRGAAAEHFKNYLGRDLVFFKGGFMTRDGFRFPKTTAVLMTLILAGVVAAIQKGEAIYTSLPYSNRQIGPIQPMHSTLTILLLVLPFYAAGAIGWIVLFALRRSGVHRLNEISASQR